MIEGFGLFPPVPDWQTKIISNYFMNFFFTSCYDEPGKWVFKTRVKYKIVFQINSAYNIHLKNNLWFQDFPK